MYRCNLDWVIQNFFRLHNLEQTMFLKYTLDCAKIWKYLSDYAIRSVFEKKTYSELCILEGIFGSRNTF